MGCEQQQLQDSLQHLQTAHDRQKELCNTYSELERLLPMMLRTVKNQWRTCVVPSQYTISACISA